MSDLVDKLKLAHPASTLDKFGKSGPTTKPAEYSQRELERLLRGEQPPTNDRVEPDPSTKEQRKRLNRMYKS